MTHAEQHLLLTWILNNLLTDSQLDVKFVPLGRTLRELIVPLSNGPECGRCGEVGGHDWDCKYHDPND